MNLVQDSNGFICPDDPGEPGKSTNGGHRQSVSELEARILAELFKGLEVLEIGTGLGVSTNKIAETAKKVYTVDPDPWVKNVVVPTLAKNVEFFRDIDDVPRPLDAAFIDGDHSYKQVFKDIQKTMLIVKPGGMMVFHDAVQSPILKAIVVSKLVPTAIATKSILALTWNEMKENKIRHIKLEDLDEVEAEKVMHDTKMFGN